MCFCCCSSVLPWPRSYADFVANIAFILSAPFVAFAILFTSIPGFLWVFLSYRGCCDFVANIFWFFTHRIIAQPINFVEKIVIHFVCFLLHPIAFCWNYRNNTKIIRFIRENTKTKTKKYRGIFLLYLQIIVALILVPYASTGLEGDLRNAIKKEGFWYIYIRVLGMYSILPAWRHTFCTNPYLFRYQLYLTNQDTNSESFNLDVMCKVAFAYMFEPSYILGASRSKSEARTKLKQIGFVPNYADDLEEMGKAQYDDLGLQVADYYSLLIFLDTLAKTPSQLCQSIAENKSIGTVMHADAPIYSDMRASAIEPQIHVPYNNFERFGLAELTLPYDHYYHIVCCIKVPEF